ncbi:unnamed protein product [Arctogadus glacialis]
MPSYLQPLLFAEKVNLSAGDPLPFITRQGDGGVGARESEVLQARTETVQAGTGAEMGEIGLCQIQKPRFCWWFTGRGRLPPEPPRRHSEDYSPGTF